MSSPVQESIESPMDSPVVNPTPPNEVGTFHPGNFDPVQPYQVLANRFEVLRKLGKGGNSTVWLAKDQRYGQYRALKILRAIGPGCRLHTFERQIMEHLRDRDPSHPGHRHVSRLFDAFELIAPYGRHLCLVLEPMGESLQTFSSLFPEFHVPAVIMQRFTRQLLLALEYAHQSGVIHADIKPQNIMVRINNLATIDRFVWRTTPESVASLSKRKQTLRGFYLTREENLMELEVVLCDWGSASWTTHHLGEIIQPLLLRAPEVMIGAPWDPKADIWSLAGTILEVLDAARLFTGRASETGGVYYVKHHLEEIVALFGPFPRRLLNEGNADFVKSFFEKNGQIRNRAVRPEASLENHVASLIKRHEKDAFIGFLGAVLKVDPKHRPSATELLKEPWVTANLPEVLFRP